MYIIQPIMQVAGTIHVGPLKPNPPIVVSAEQATGYVVIGILPASPSGPFVPYKFRLYRTDPSNTTIQVYETLVSPTSLENLLFDGSAVVGIHYTYYSTTLDILGHESNPSNSVNFTPFDTTKFLPFSVNRNITPSAYGPYPVLGSDFYLDPITHDMVIAPNGDYLAVNGLACLAQDLRNHILTDVGELPMHPNFGFQRGGIIGSGQADPQAQAQALNTRVRDILGSESRILSVIDLQISHVTADGWTISYIVQAIGVEDPQELNAVIPYLTGGSRSGSS